MTDKPMTDKDLKAVRNLQDSLIDGIMAETDEGTLADLAEDGLDPEKEAALIGPILRLRRVGLGCRSPRLQSSGTANGSLPCPVGQWRRTTSLTLKKLTRAARNGKEQSEADIRTEAEDLARIREFQSGKPKIEAPLRGGKIAAGTGRGNSGGYQS